jgi:hypothetical protein
MLDDEIAVSVVVIHAVGHAPLVFEPLAKEAVMMTLISRVLLHRQEDVSVSWVAFSKCLSQKVKMGVASVFIKDVHRKEDVVKTSDEALKHGSVSSPSCERDRLRGLW